MKLHTRIFRIMAGLLIGAAVLSSCAQKEEEFSTNGKTPLATPTVMAGEVSTSSISFSWSEIENAGQYYYKVVNPLGYTVSKGFTENTYATVKGLKFSTDFTVYVNAVPDAAFAKKYCSSEQAQIVLTTDDPIIINYDWVKDGEAWFYNDGTWNKSKVTVGREAGTGHFIITSWIGAEGFDLYFDIKDWDGTFPVSFHYSSPQFQPLVGQAIDQSGPIGDRGDIELGHGLGGKAYDYIYWYGKGASYDQGTLDPSGGYIECWVKDYDGTWCGYRVEYGSYEPEPEPDPVPDADPTADWTSDVIITVGDEELSESTLSFSAATGKYTLPAWYGVDGYDVVFTRDEKVGDWIIDPECSAYAGEEDGKVGLYHGLGKARQSICWIDPTDWATGLSGNTDAGNIYAAITGPDGEDVTYKATWPVVTYAWTLEGSYYCGRYDSTNTTTLSYNAEDDTYTLIVPEYSNAKVIFATDDEGTFIPVGGSLQKSNDTWWWIDYNDGADYVWVKVPTSSVDLASGQIKLDIWNGSDSWTDTFTWKALPGIDDLVGTYTQATEGWWWNGSSWVYPSWTGDVTITKASDNTIQITGLLDVEESIVGTVDAKISTISMEPGQAYNGYLFSAYDTGETVYATFDADGNITFTTNWRLTNAGGSLYYDNIITTLTKK